MKRILALSMVVVFLAMASCSYAYTIGDSANDRIGDRVFETYGINVSDIYSKGGFTIDIYTNYPQTGYTVGSWVTQPADLFITETYLGNTYEWSLVLKDHDGFTAGTLYAVGSYLTPDELAPGSGYTYNHGVPVALKTVGDNYGYASIPGSTVAWNALAGNPDWMIHIQAAFFEDDPNGKLAFLWGTGTCANDVVQGTSSVVPLPGAILLFGSGLLRLIGMRRRIA